MNNAPYRIILVIISTGVAVVAGLYLLAYNRSPVPYFTRTFTKEFLGEKIIIPKQKNQYIAGITNSLLSIGTKGDQLLHTYDFKNRQLNAIRIAHSLLNDSNTFIKIDSPYYYVIDRKVPYISYWKDPSDSLVHHSPDLVPYLQCVPLCPTSYAIRAINGRNENCLLKITSQSPFLISDNSILEKQNEGLFSTAGALHYSKKLHRLIYLYYYRNQYIQTDTVLNVISRSATIDSNHYAKTKVIHLKSGSYSLANPDAIINRISYVYENYLYVNSSVAGKGEDDHSRSVIDVYDLVDRSYLRSFYLPDYPNRKAKSFFVTAKNCVVDYDDAFAIQWNK